MITGKKLVIAATLLLPGRLAAADSGHFNIPATAKVVTAGTVPGAGGLDVPPSDCTNRGAMETWIDGWRQRARQAYANKVARSIPSLNLVSPVPGVSCIRSPDAFDARYEPSGDYFVLTCLAQSGGKFTHVIRNDLNVVPDVCLSDARIHQWVSSPACTAAPNSAQIYLNTVLKQCAIAPAVPQFRGAPVGYEIDPESFNKMINDSPAILHIIDQDRRVKGSAGSSSGGQGGASHHDAPKCANPLGCDAPGSSDSAE